MIQRIVEEAQIPKVVCTVESPKALGKGCGQVAGVGAGADP